MKYTAFVFNIFCAISGHIALETENILIAVKTAEKYESTRLRIIFDTWFRLARDQIWFITDIGKTEEFRSFQNISNNHMVVTNCGGSRRHADHCCKTNVELHWWNFAVKTEEIIKWLCLFDDDHYVNVPNLIKELEKYNDNKLWYLGRRFYDNKNKISKKKFKYDPLKTWFFANLGAGVCLSKALLNKLQPYIRYNRFEQLCQFIDDADEVTLGFLCEMKLGVNLTHIPTFHTQYENLSEMPPELLKKQISVGNYKTKTIQVDEFSIEKDPSRYQVLLSSLFLGILFKQIKTKI